MYAKIQPVATFPLPSIFLTIDNVIVTPGLCANFAWSLRGDSSVAQATGSINLGGAAYAAWGADDEYLYRYAAEQLGLVIVEIVRDVAQAPEEVSQ